VYGLPRDFAAIWQRNHALFPRGIDLILCAGNQLAALPRSVSIREG
jgi:alpha-D-ribose 1-methylphosphonate 5-triphosphate synthase subunit PhnH